MIGVRLYIFNILMCALTCLFNCSCGNSGSDTAFSPVPLPKAWPRIDISTSDSMTPVPELPVGVKVNPLAAWETLETYPPGLTVTYPNGSAKIYYTFIETPDKTERDRVIEMRMQRISLNLNGTPAKTFHSSVNESEPQIGGALVVALSGTQTPVQLLAEKPGWIVSGTAFIDDSRAVVAYDSLLPLIEVLQFDMAHSLKDINFDNLPANAEIQSVKD